MTELDEDQMYDLASHLQGTCKSIYDGIESIGLDADEFDFESIEAELGDYGIELCKGCDWWHECCQLDGGDDGEAGYCDQCNADRRHHQSAFMEMVAEMEAEGSPQKGQTVSQMVAAIKAAERGPQATVFYLLGRPYPPASTVDSYIASGRRNEERPDGL